MPEYDFQGQVAFITGAGRGQGRSHAINFAEQGADVVVTDICNTPSGTQYELSSSDDLEETARLVEETGQRALRLEMDVRDESQVESAINEALDEFGKIDILGNNAGIWSVKHLVKMEGEMWDVMLDTVLKGVWLCSKHVGQHMIERGNGGKIISTASTVAHVGELGAGHYTAGKHGVVGLTKTLALELAEYDINVNAVSPTGVDTQMISGVAEAVGEEALEGMTELGGPTNVFEEGKLLEPQAVSEAYLWLASNAARRVTGIALPVDAGYLAK